LKSFDESKSRLTNTLTTAIAQILADFVMASSRKRYRARTRARLQQIFAQQLEKFFPVNGCMRAHLLLQFDR